jgi:uncharacterized damage-inducible protein DinB
MADIKLQELSMSDLKDFLRDMYNFHYQCNNDLADQLIANVEQLSSTTVPLFLHVINAQQVWNARILDEAPSASAHNLEECKTVNAENYENTLRIIKEADFQHQIIFGPNEEEQYSNSVLEVLFQVANHSTHHRAQIVAELRLNNITPIYTDYIFYRSHRVQ